MCVPNGHAVQYFVRTGVGIIRAVGRVQRDHWSYANLADNKPP